MINTILITSFVIVVVASIIAAIVIPSNAGDLGEFQIYHLLKKSTNEVVLTNVYLPNSKGGSTEVDLIYITPKGIFVIESKNYRGYIYGSTDERNWTVSAYSGHKLERHKFYNPVWQNNTHIRCLKEYLNMEIPYYSLIVFSGRGRLRDIINDKGVYIIKQSELRDCIKTIYERNPDVLTEQQITEIHDVLFPLVDKSKEAKTAHAQEIKERFENTETCPSCGGQLVLRTVKKGKNMGNQFYGCSNFPKCRYTHQI